MIDQQNLNGWQDPGHDSSVIPFDRFGEVIGYNVIGHIGSAQGAGIKYNGNISWQIYQMNSVPFSGSLGTAYLVGNSYTYDSTNRLTASNFGYYYGSGWQTTAAFDAGYSYDNAGNFTTLQRYGSTGSIQDNLTYTYGTGSNRLFTISGSSTASYTYDSNGNVRYDTHRGIGYIIYDPNNLPVYAYLTNGQQLIYENDVNGSRVRNTISGTSDNFYFYGVEGNTEAVSTVAHGSNLIYNILGAGGDNIGQVKVVSQSPTRYYYLKDHLGSIKVTVDTTGTVVGYDDYYPYGMQMSGRSLVASEDGRYKFTGKELDSDEGLYYFGARYYDTWNARWYQVDPNSDDNADVSPYNYCMNNPVNFIDIDGRDTTMVINGVLEQHVYDPVYATNNSDFPVYIISNQQESYHAYGNRNETFYEYVDRIEVRTGGTPSWRNNNPGNLEYRSRKNGAIGRSGSIQNGLPRWAVFPSYIKGRQAKIRLLKTTYNDFTIEEMMYKYAPQNENDTEGYIEFLCKRTGLSRDREISSLSDSELGNLVKSMQIKEGYKIGNISIINNK